MNNVSKGLGQKDRTLLYCSWSPKQTTAGSSRPCFLIQWADSIRESILVSPAFICLKDFVWDSGTLLSFPSSMVDIVLLICSYTDVSCAVQGYLLNVARKIRIQFPEDSNRPWLECACGALRWVLSIVFAQSSYFLLGGCSEKGEACRKVPITFSEQVPDYLVHRANYY